MRRALAASSALAALILVAACQQEAPPPAANPPPQTAGPGSPDWNPALGPVLLDISGPVSEAPGTLIYATPDALWSMPPSTKKKEKLLSFPQGNLPVAPATSPDGKVVAFSLYTPSGDGRTPGGTSLYVVNRDGSGQRVVQAYDQPLSSLSEPAWASDGRSLYFTYRGASGNFRIERINLDGSGRTTVVENAFNPAVSPDGGGIAYIRSEPNSFVQSIYAAAANGGGERRVVDGEQFEGIGSPRFSRDGDRVLFVAVGGPGVSAPPRAQHFAPSSWLSPAAAEAHGVPWDLWVVGSTSPEPARLTKLGEDGPIPVWSPDGGWIAFSGELGIYLMRGDGAGLVRLSDEWVTGGIGWLP